jgi:hypothetical protein
VYVRDVRYRTKDSTMAAWILLIAIVIALVGTVGGATLLIRSERRKIERQLVAEVEEHLREKTR